MRTKLLYWVAFAIVGGLVFNSCKESDDELPLVKADFTYEPTSDIEVGDTVRFTNNSEEATDYTWKSNGEPIATDENLSIIFEDEGEHTITLIASNGNVQDSATEKVLVNVEPNPMNYIINYGSYSGDKSTITLFNEASDEISNGYYKAVNNVDMLSNVQYAYEYNGTIYFMGNNADQVFFVDANTFEQSANGITDKIVKPRYCVGNESTLYVSCWGGDIWTDNTLSYIAKVDLESNSVVSTISLPGGPEGLEIANGKLYAALNYKDSVAVINLDDDAISYIATPAVSSYFAKDNSNNLYVTLLSTYSIPSDVTGVGYINTTTNEFEASYTLDGVSTGYVNVLAPNNDFSKMYVLASSWVQEGEDWVQKGSVATFNTESKAFETEMFVSGVEGINGVEVDPVTGNVLVFKSQSVESYNVDGTLINEYTTGTSPFMLLTVK